MDNPLERVRISQTAEEQLIKLKRSTKIKQWNILCRWALCRSLAEPSIPSPVAIKTDSKVEIAWNVFGGEIANILLIALKQRCHQDGLGTEPDTLKQQFTLHLHRGIGYLAGDQNIQQIEDLAALSLPTGIISNE
jgi:DNA sulfur modification protein DndE